jgi:hypothetical protein
VKSPRLNLYHLPAYIWTQRPGLSTIYDHKFGKIADVRLTKKQLEKLASMSFSHFHLEQIWLSEGRMQTLSVEKWRARYFEALYTLYVMAPRIVQ